MRHIQFDIKSDPLTSPPRLLTRSQAPTCMHIGLAVDDSLGAVSTPRRLA